ncbi:RagB/SusD family nutrient uptake outer membrane protein [Mucilaginibacter mali]|uniref:RagB/SusD family nutrient uptake outer membrane protein n=1 Tax=Mucilaginibacter mali TaxID=2740462 RepID=A0A7D4UC63_9SPHI|nr:RagB/SusD family nutrient uptake outer membrane protein [Mucilaginibacter mali]QKJ28959.1 RagB/SusD family nutrient uptake outer membrane protein [Mucilaginibacter mali]
MNKKIFVVSLIIMLSSSFTACKKILDIQPQNQISTEAALKDVSGYYALLISVYDRMQSYTFWGRDMALEGDALADNIYTVTALAGGRYTTVNTNTRGAHYNIWTQAYAAINDLNNIIAGIDAAPAVGNTQLLQQAQVKAEAYALRGMIYFDIARVYGFEPNKVPTTGTDASFDKSAVIRLTPTTSFDQASSINRSTITQTYTQIESDLNKAIATFKASYSFTTVKKPTNPYHINESATHAFLGKLYLYWEKYPQAVTEFDNALDPTITPSTLAPITAGTYNAAFKKIPNPESLLELYYNQSVEVVGVTGSNDAPFTYTQPTGYNAANVATFAGQTASAELVALFEANDDRKGMFFNSRTTTNTNVYTWANKYSGAGGAFTDNILMMRYSDIILMKAEALANQTQYVAAAALVTTLRTARNATLAVPTDASLLTFIQTERRRELFFEGHRWFDLKRLGNGITKPALTAVGTIAATDYRLLAPLPTAEVTLNPALPQNPNY